MMSDEVLFWQRTSNDLGIEVVAPFEVTLSDGSQFTFPALVKDFGNRNGMVVAADFAVIRPHAQKLLDAGYGYSSNIGHSPESYQREDMIKILADWGWTGSRERKPSWLP
jgi:hypothetical protein